MLHLNKRLACHGFCVRGVRLRSHLEAHFRRADTPKAAVFDTCAVHGTEASASSSLLSYEIPSLSCATTP